jgi:hypothetical protein
MKNVPRMSKYLCKKEVLKEEWIEEQKKKNKNEWKVDSNIKSCLIAIIVAWWNIVKLAICTTLCPIVNRSLIGYW